MVAVALRVNDHHLCWVARAFRVSSLPTKISSHANALEAHRRYLIKHFSLAYASVMFLWGLLAKKKNK